MRACDYNVYRIKYKTTYAERIPTIGGMDSELSGKTITEECDYLCVAPDENFTRIAFSRYHLKDEIISIEHIGQLNDMVYLQ